MTTFAESQTLSVSEPIEPFESLAVEAGLYIPSAERLRCELMTEPNRDYELIDGTHTLHKNGTSSVNGAASGSSVGRPERILTLPRVSYREDYFNAIQKWEGFVIAVEDDVFTARLSPLEGKGSEQVAEIFWDQVTDGDRSLVEPGALFYWSIGLFRKATGTVMYSSVLRFRRLAGWTARSRAAAKEQVAALKALLDGE